jgi:hypothetical protein
LLRYIYAMQTMTVFYYSLWFPIPCARCINIEYWSKAICGAVFAHLVYIRYTYHIHTFTSTIFYRRYAKYPGCWTHRVREWIHMTVFVERVTTTININSLHAFGMPCLQKLLFLLLSLLHIHHMLCIIFKIIKRDATWHVTSRADVL